jgi:dihydropyrimidinase
MTERTLVIRNGMVVNATGAAQFDVVVEGERVKALTLPGTFDLADETIDASGKLVLPGLIDPHVHLNSPFMGTVTVHDFYTGTRAAAFGGTTCIIDFSTQEKGASILENLMQKEAQAEGHALVDWSMHGILLDASDQTLAEIPRLVVAGVPTYKCFTTYRHAGRMMDDASLLRVLQTTADQGAMLMVHCEDNTLIEYGVQRELEAAHWSAIYHARSRPALAENESIRRLMVLTGMVPASVYVVHMSTAESVGIIEAAQDRGLPVHGETCTHYLTLTEDALNDENGGLFICSPPLRTGADNAALWRGVSNGRIEVVSTDDAGVPTPDRIRLGAGRFDRVPNGMPGIEPRLTMLYTEGVRKGRITLPQLVALGSTNPARLFGLYPRKGHLGPGADADIVIFDPNVEWTMTAQSLHMNTDFCPFEGWKVIGRPETVLSRGQFVIRDGALVGKPGHGQRVFRQLDERRYPN